MIFIYNDKHITCWLSTCWFPKLQSKVLVGKQWYGVRAPEVVIPQIPEPHGPVKYYVDKQGFMDEEHGFLDSHTLQNYR